jgi:hypothetical protein
VIHLALVFKAEKQASARQTPFAFGLDIDNSGSMAGRHLEYAKSAATMVLKHLRDDDRFGLVVFSDSARTIIPLQVASDMEAFSEAIRPDTTAERKSEIEKQLIAYCRLDTLAWCGFGSCSAGAPGTTD